MRALLGIVSLLLALGIGYYLIKMQANQSAGGQPPKQQIDLAAIRSDLLSMAQAERYYMATNGNYASLEELQKSSGMEVLSSRRGYSYTVDVDNGRHFRIMASPSVSSNSEWPTLSIDETMQISTH